MRKENKKAFSLIELMIVIAIIGILASVILISFSGKKRAAIKSYMTSMKSIQTAVELCTGTNGTAQNGAPNSNTCNPANGSLYPTVHSYCGNAPYFCVNNPTGNNWQVTTATNATCATSWDCQGCRLFCDVNKCTPVGTCQ